MIIQPKENWFKVSLVIIIAILGVVGLFIFKGQEKQRFFAENMARCATLGKQEYGKEKDEEKKEKSQYDPIVSYREPIYVYNVEFQKCFYTNKKSLYNPVTRTTVDEEYIKDLNTNEALEVLLIPTTDQTTLDVYRDVFFQQKKRAYLYGTPDGLKKAEQDENKYLEENTE